MRRSTRRRYGVGPGAVGLVAATLVSLPVMTLTAPTAGATTASKSNPDQALEVCEGMVRNAVERAIAAPLPVPQQGAWQNQAKTRYRCNYDVGDGRMTLTVRVLEDTARAKHAYTEVRSTAVEPQRLNGLGQAAFQAADGTLVARKDRFVLMIDPTALPARLAKADVAFAAIVAVMDCW